MGGKTPKNCTDPMVTLSSRPPSRSPSLQPHSHPKRTHSPMPPKTAPPLKLEIPEAMGFIFQPSRYKVAYGGRGSAKSWSIARALIALAFSSREFILCAREIQKSIEESVHKLLEEQIEVMGLSPYFEVQKQSITCTRNGSKFSFSGIRNNVTKIKSMEGITRCWVEEAEKISKSSWKVLIPTIRMNNSEIWVSFNPDMETDPTYQQFVTNPPPEAIVRMVNWRDNPWFPDVLRKEKDYLKRVDYDAYLNVWEGQPVQRSDAQVLKDKWRVDWFVPQKDWNGPYYGADWGFANDPAALVRCCIGGKTLYVDHEFWGIGVDIDKLPEAFEAVPGSRDHVCRADSARPETISYMVRHGYPKMEAAKKWTGSVEDGIAFLRQFEEIVIHSRCEHAAQEARLWSYKVDKLNDDVLPELKEGNEHCWDACRYALEPLMKTSFFHGCSFKEAPDA